MFLDSPLTSWTDYVLAAASLGFAVDLARSIGPRNRVSARLWSTAFLAASVAAALGGTYHGFGSRLDPSALDVLWNCTVFSMGVATGLVAAAVHTADVRRGDGTITWLTLAIAVTLTGAAVQQQAFAVTRGLNKNAAYHLIQLVGLYLLFRCAHTVRDRESSWR
jgi:hypothetical protein